MRAAEGVGPYKGAVAKRLGDTPPPLARSPSPCRGGMRLPKTRRVKAGRPATFGPLPAAPALRRAPCDVDARRPRRAVSAFWQIVL